MEAEGIEFDSLWQALDETLDQVFVKKATWGLDILEHELGIQTDSSKPIDQRRSIVISKLRGVGTVTAKMIQGVAEAFTNGEVEVTENITPYTIDIKFVGKRGVPENLADIQQALREIIPAHLAIHYTFTYLVWNELDAQRWTWDILDGRGFTWDSLSVFRP